MKRGWYWIAIFITWLVVGYAVILPAYEYEEVVLKCSNINGVVTCQRK